MSPFPFFSLPMSTGPKSISVLLQDALELVQHLIRPLLVGAIIFGLIMGLVGHQLATVSSGMASLSGFEQRLEDFQQKMEDANRRLAAGDADAFNKIQIPAADVAVMQNTMMTAIPALVGGSLLMLLISILSRAYMSIVIVRKIVDPIQAAQAFGSNALSLVLLWIWLFLRSFVWIPFVGWIIAIVLFPRFVAAPIYLLEEKKGVRESTRLSIRVTIGSWLRIVLPCLAAAIIMAVVSWALQYVLSGVGILLAGMLLAIISELLSAWVMATGIVVARDVIAHPTAKLMKA